MIRRVYVCDSCDHTLEVYQELHDPKRLKKCPSCKKMKLYQDLSGVYVGVREVKTIGQLAEQNAKKLGKYGLDAMEEKEENKKREDYNRQKEQIEKNFPKTKMAAYDDKDPIPKTPNHIKKAISSQPTNKAKAERAKKYVLEGK